MNLVKSATQVVVQFLNQPVVKEGVKNVAGSVTYIFGCVGADKASKVLQGVNIISEDHSAEPEWRQTAYKVSAACALISLVLSGATSRPGVYIIGTLVGTVFSTQQLDQVFGPNTIFAVNPWHPRHVASIAAVILALPAVMQATYDGACWCYRKVSSINEPVVPSLRNEWLTDARIRLMIVFNTITSRPVLHIGNHLGRWIIVRSPS